MSDDTLKLYFRIPAGNVAGLDFLGFCDHIVDQSPAIETRSHLRLAMKAREAVDAQQDGVVEMPEGLANFWKQACEQAPIPARLVGFQDPQGKWIGEPDKVPKRAYDRFYEAIESMSTKRPEAELAQAAE